MFRKSDLLEMLSRDLARARKKRDVLTSDITALSTQIADLEVQLSAENDRRERERAANEIEDIKKHLRDLYLAFVPAIAGIRDGTEKAAAIVPEAREFAELLEIIAAEVRNTTDALLGDLEVRIDALRAGTLAPEALQSLGGAAELQQDNDRELLRLPEWLAQRKAKSAADPCCAAAA
jgi:septal ring factor EnvC (AmiA/AmiB activator)